jgi:hypothetical protein
MDWSATMIKITLSSEQIRTAPAEVRRCIEHEVGASLGLQVQAPDSQGRTEQLAICSLDELATIFSLDRGSTETNMNVVGADELRAIVGNLDDGKVSEILNLGPAIAELQQAAVCAAAGDGDVLTKGDHAISDKVC